jgi:hypothetical protein
MKISNLEQSSMTVTGRRSAMWGKRVMILIALAFVASRN